MDASDLGHATKVLVSDPQQAHRTMTDLWLKVVKPRTQLGQELEITVALAEDDRTVQANRFYWGVVLKDISEQASIGGQRWVAEAWHEHFKRTILGYEIEKVTVAGRRRKHVIRRLRSTSKLKVRAWHAYLDKLMAYAVNELGVAFTEPPSWWGGK